MAIVTWQLCYFPDLGTMMGIASTLSSIPGFLAPEVVGWITNSGVSMVKSPKAHLTNIDAL